MDLEVSRDDIGRAADRIEPFVRRTPVLELGDTVGLDCDLILKLDSLQVTGSFKPRGAFSILTAADVPSPGVVVASGGNFGLAIAHASSVLGHTATVFVPETSPEEKIGRISGYGADVSLIPGYYPQALEASLEFAEASGALVAHAYDHRDVIGGQGTCAMEITEQVPGMDTVIVAVGGGGLIGGIASWIRDDAKVVAVETELCPTLHEARKAGHPVDVEVGGVAASSLGAGRVGEYPWHANRWIDESLLLSDEDVVAAQRWLWDDARVLAETSASCTVAAVLSGVYQPEPGERVVAVISGANTDPAALS
jgi:threonine dehydratase